MAPREVSVFCVRFPSRLHVHASVSFYWSFLPTAKLCANRQAVLGATSEPLRCAAQSRQCRPKRFPSGSLAKHERQLLGNSLISLTLPAPPAISRSRAESMSSTSNMAPFDRPGMKPSDSVSDSEGRRSEIEL